MHSFGLRDSDDLKVAEHEILQLLRSGAEGPVLALMLSGVTIPEI
jgi:hypothetical protein